MMLLIRTVLLIAVTPPIVHSQYRVDSYEEKPGSCPPALPVQICSRSCFSDQHCSGIGKCCQTSCGGFVCSRPVTMKQYNRLEKPGSCPSIPTGRWVCSPTCRDDSDCRETKKCCKNRCGALTCQNPETEIINSVEIPVIPLEENPAYAIAVNNRNPYYNYNSN